jgi:UDP-N-acetylglucosamine transferase subunit ALG13
VQVSKPPLRESRGPVFATVGADYHPFDRLMLWLDHWLQDSAPDVSCVAQTGPSLVPARARSTKFQTYREIWTAMRRASLVVSHAGPGGVLMARDAGHCPVVVPRRREFGEAVDNHQVSFARWLASRRIAHVAEDELSFRVAISKALRSGRSGRPAQESRSSEVALRFDLLIDELVASSRQVLRNELMVE